mmetsp:Transcript_35374/g.69815  ORF Transcript_35374/g.69815 Transcript_35374/m.69815 type:complete len:167 (+) Transcript_35374:659-1159(+)
MLKDPLFSLPDLFKGGRQTMGESVQAMKTLRKKFESEYARMVQEDCVPPVPPFYQETFTHPALIDKKEKKEREFVLFYRKPLECLQYLITRACKRWPGGDESIKIIPEEIYQPKVGGDGQERVYGPHANSGDFFIDAFQALIGSQELTVLTIETFVLESDFEKLSF